MTTKEKNIFNYGKIVGILETMARFNDKTNHSYHFELTKFPKIESIQKSLPDSIGNVATSFNLNEIDVRNGSDVFFKLFYDWFYQYQDKNGIHLEDNKQNFSLYFDSWKKEWMEDFVDLMLETIEPKKIHKIEYVGLEGYYASVYDEFILECDNEIYYLNLQVTD
ncbi:hypothetical protein [Maribacter sp.]|uniref:hypothetical protein n=1 Tax=Maribacter sp. TaxID=1897614 RepID=UPI0025C6E7E2|nr:hypothetical protein [Maribacter sp.]